MHERLRPLALLAGVLLALQVAAAAAQVPVARVDGIEISLAQLDRRFDEQLRARGLNIARMQKPAQVRDLKREALDLLIRDELLWQKAQRDGLVAGEAEVERVIGQSIAQARSRDAFLRGIARAGFDEQSFRRHVRRMLSADRAAQGLVEAHVEVTDEDVARFYEANRERFSRPEQVRLRQIAIAVPAGADAAERARRRARIESLRTRLAAGEDFADLARRYSEHPTRPWGGELDPVGRGQLAPALEEAAFGLRPGETSAVIETEAGFHLLRLDERLPAATIALEQARERIRQHLTEQRGREVLEREVAALRSRATVEILVPL